MIILDTGPLVAFLSKRDKYHSWAYGQFQENPFPFITSESVVSEAVFFLQTQPEQIKNLHDLFALGAIEVAFNFHPEADAIFQLLKKYKDTPMDLADACLVRLAELHPKSKILTLDSDFTVYRKHRNKTLDVIMPE